jgi:small multidrug resistance pump
VTIYWLALIFAVSISVLGESLLKAAASAKTFRSQLSDLRTLAGMIFYSAAALLYMIALRRIPISVAMPYTAGSYVAIAFVGRFVFNELLGFFQIAGILLIVVGICLLTFGVN